MCLDCALGPSVILFIFCLWNLPQHCLEPNLCLEQQLLWGRACHASLQSWDELPAHTEKASVLIQTWNPSAEEVGLGRCLRLAGQLACSNLGTSSPKERYYIKEYDRWILRNDMQSWRLASICMWICELTGTHSTHIHIHNYSSYLIIWIGNSLNCFSGPDFVL